jgi:hypothetical protein
LTSTALIFLADDLLLEVAPQRLDLRQLRHQSRPPVVSSSCAPSRSSSCAWSAPVPSPASVGAQHLPGFACRRLLGLLLRPALAPAAPTVADPDRGQEALGVVRALVDDLVRREAVEVPGRQLLQAGLVVLAAGSEGGLGDRGAEQVEHELAAAGQPPSR